MKVPLSVCYPDMMRGYFLKRYLTAVCSKVRGVSHTGACRQQGSWPRGMPS